MSSILNDKSDALSSVPTTIASTEVDITIIFYTMDRPAKSCDYAIHIYRTTMVSMMKNKKEVRVLNRCTVPVINLVL